MTGAHAARNVAPLLSAEFPLKGAQTGSTLTLRPLLCAEVLMPSNWFHRRPGIMETLKGFGIGVSAAGLMEIPIPAFLLEHPSAGLVLVDTGMLGSIATGGLRERMHNLGPIGQLMSRHAHMQPEQAVSAQLRALGIDSRDIGLVVMTHLHFDHASALCDFPDATVLVSAPEWQAAWSRGSSMHGYWTAQFDPRPRYRTVDFSAPPTATRGPFEHTIDLFGDDSLTLVSTPGHTLGHLSLIARLDGCEALLVGDAAYTIATIREGERPMRIEDLEAYEHSLSQIQRYDQENPDALIVPGHDMGAWRSVCARLSGGAPNSETPPSHQSGG
jgi:glyoxylase-like metal-dependent hydrolase (beta-lactamase superfamily II)